MCGKQADALLLRIFFWVLNQTFLAVGIDGKFTEKFHFCCQAD